MMRHMQWRAVLSGVLLLVSLTGCGLTIPTDPDGTLDRVRAEEVLRAGASPSPGWVEVAGTSQNPSGREVELVEAFAASLDADVIWTVAGEEHLVGLLEDGKLDLVVGGITDKNPWMEKAALTRPYVEQRVSGTTEAHVMMLPMGENAFQSELERWLDDHGTGS
jgi:ABC-type amino acid transport substrate-binding protein